MKRQRITPGAILEIKASEKYYYAQILESKDCAFFQLERPNPLSDIKVLNGVEVIFIVRVYDDVITKGKWEKIGKLEIRNDLKIAPDKFVQDVMNPDIFRIYNPNTGEMKSATRAECIGLERSSVWEAEHVEGRLADHFKGVPNIWVEQLSIK